MRHAVCLAALVVIGVTSGWAVHAQAPQQPGATFRSGTRLIVQNVTVKDKDGKPIEGLTAKDLTITEDGVPQPISFVEFQRLASTSAASSFAAPAATADKPVLAQISPSQPGGIRYGDRRLLVLYFDLTATPPADQMRAYAAAQKFIDTQMDPSALMALMTFEGGSVRVKTDFTDDKARLREVMLRLIYGDDLDGDGIPDNPEVGTAFGQDDAEFNIFNTDRQLSALQTAMAMLQSIPEQKSLIYFASNLRLNGVDNHAQLRATTNAARRANVTIHSIDARGLVAQAPLGDATRQSPGGLAMFTGQAAGVMTGNFQRSQDTLHALAKDTGGTAMFDYNDLSLGIVRAAEAMTSYYIIGYYTTHTEPDGRFHRVRVTLNGDRTAELSYREGYYADKTFTKFSAADKERQLEEALMLENPITEIAIAMEVNYFQLNRAEYFVPLAVKIPGSELALARRRGAARTLIDFIGEVKDDYGITIQNVRDKLDIKLSDETAAQLARRPIQYETGFTLLPGKYVIKFLARDAETGRIGTFQTSFTIPNVNREDRRVQISSVVLASQRVPLGDSLYTVQKNAAQTNPLVHDGHKLFPSVTRVFTRSQDLHVFFQTYQRDATTTRPVVAFVTLYRGAEKVLETSPLGMTDGFDSRKAVPVRLTVPLVSVAVGRYDCQVTVLDPTTQKATFWRAPIVVLR